MKRMHSDLEKDLVQQCKDSAKAMNAFLAVVGQYKAKHSGTTLGFPDLVLICSGKVVLIETKRATGGVLSLGQHAFIAMALEQGVEVEVIDKVQDFEALVNRCRRKH